MCPSVQTTCFEPLDIETSVLVCRYILTISRKSLSIKVIGSRSMSYDKMIILLISTCESSIYGYRSLINEVKVTHQGEGHVKVKLKMSTFFPILCQILLTNYFSVCDYRSLIRSSSYIKVKVTLRSK